MFTGCWLSLLIPQLLFLFKPLFPVPILKYVSSCAPMDFLFFFLPGKTYRACHLTPSLYWVARLSQTLFFVRSDIRKLILTQVFKLLAWLKLWTDLSISKLVHVQICAGVTSKRLYLWPFKELITGANTRYTETGLCFLQHLITDRWKPAEALKSHGAPLGSVPAAAAAVMQIL